MQTAHIPMLTQGPDLNLSAEGLTAAQLVDIGHKLTYKQGQSIAQILQQGYDVNSK